MKSKIIFLFFILLLQLTSTFAQNQQKIDSLMLQLKSTNDTTRINLLNKIVKFYNEYNSDSTLKYIKIALNEAKSINFEKGIARTYEFYGTYYFSQGEYFLAKEKYNKSLKIYENLENNNKIAGIYIRIATLNIIENNILDAFTLLNKAKKYGNEETISQCNYSLAYIYNKIENYEKSLHYILLSLNYYENQSDSLQIAHCNNLIGSVYLKIENDSNALIYYSKALNIYKTRSRIDYAYALGNIAVIDKRNKKFEIAIKKHLKTAKILFEIQDNYHLANTYNNLGNSYYELSNFTEAERYFNMSKDIRIKLNDSAGLAGYYLNMGNLYKNNNKISKSLEYFMNSIEIAEKFHATSTLRENYYSLYEIYLQQNNFQKALEYHLKFIEIKDSVFTLEKEKSINNITISYETEKKEKQIDFLNKENKLVKMTVEQQKKTFILLFFILIIISIFIFILILLYLKLKNTYKQLIQKDTEIIIAENTIGKNIKKINDLKYTKNSTEKEIASNILKLMEESQIFTDSNLSVSVLAAYCNTNPKYISNTINSVFKQNFNSFINEYRIKYACRLIIQEKYKNYSFAAIAKEVGFNSNTTFINSFKKNTGVTPSYYIKNLNN